MAMGRVAGEHMMLVAGSDQKGNWEIGRTFQWWLTKIRFGNSIYPTGNRKPLRISDKEVAVLTCHFRVGLGVRMQKIGQRHRF